MSSYPLIAINPRRNPGSEAGRSTSSGDELSLRHLQQETHCLCENTGTSTTSMNCINRDIDHHDSTATAEIPQFSELSYPKLSARNGHEDNLAQEPDRHNILPKSSARAMTKNASLPQQRDDMVSAMQNLARQPTNTVSQH